MTSRAELLSSYLGQLEVQEPPGPSVGRLRELHRAHVLRFAHDTLWKIRGRTPACAAIDLVQSLLAGEGGGCLHLNGGLCWLLRALGYDASLHPARVQRAFDTEAMDRYEHAVVTVRLAGETWYADVGLGNGLLEPVPLVDGSFCQAGGFTYRLEHVADGTWRFHHDRRLLAMRAVEFDLVPWEVEDFAGIFHRDATDPASHSLRQIMVNRRLPDGVLALVGTSLVRRGEQRRSLEHLVSSTEWEAVLRDEFGLRLPGWDSHERERMWAVATGESAPR